MTINTEVYDEVELAEIMERMERESKILEIRSKVFQGSEDVDKIIDPKKECQECGDLIPIERQRAKPNAVYCIECQQWHDDVESRKRKLTGTGTSNLFG